VFSSFDANLSKPSNFFMFGHSKKWQEVKSGEFGGCGSNSQPNFTNFGAAARDRCAGTLAFFFAKWGRFSSNASSDLPNN
jgi:hypothetical protein